MAEGPKQVTAWQGYGIYADYDANAPDSEDRLFVATEELAQQVCAKLNENPRAHGDLAYCEGWEWCKSFQYHEVILLDKSAFATSLDELELDYELIGPLVPGDRPGEVQWSGSHDPQYARSPSAGFAKPPIRWAMLSGSSWRTGSSWRPSRTWFESRLSKRS